MFKRTMVMMANNTMVQKVPQKQQKISDSIDLQKSEICSDSYIDVNRRADGHLQLQNNTLQSENFQDFTKTNGEHCSTRNSSKSWPVNINKDFKQSIIDKCASAREKICRNWKNLKKAFSDISPVKLLNVMSEHKLLSPEHFPDVNKMPKSLALDSILTACTSYVSNQDTFEKFAKLTAEINSNQIIVWEAQVEYPPPTADYIINFEQNLQLEKMLKLDHIIKIKDDFLQLLIFTFHDQRQIVKDLVERKTSKYFFEKIFEAHKINKGSISCLVNSLCELQEDYRQIKMFLKNIKTSHRQNETTRDSQIIRCFVKDCKINESSQGLVESFTIKLDIQHNGDKKAVDNALEQGVLNAALVFKTACDSYVEKTEPGCLEIYLSSIHGDIRKKLTNSLYDGTYLNLMENIINVEKMKTLLRPGKYKLMTRIVTLQGRRESSLRKTDADVAHKMMKQLISANRSFLIKEIDAAYLIDVFESEGILPGITKLKGDGRKLAEYFLKAIEIYGLDEKLCEVLKMKQMTYIYERLTTFKNVYAYSDISNLQKQFKKQFLNLITTVDLDDVRPIFEERNIFKTELFETLENSFEDRREEGMAQFLVEILKSGPLAMLTFVDSLYVCHMNELANSLMEPIEDIMETDEETVANLSYQQTAGDECLFEGIYELIVRETDNEGQCSIVTSTVDLSLTTTLSGDMYTVETVPQDKNNRMELSRIPTKIEKLQQTTEKMKNYGDNLVRPKTVFPYRTPHTGKKRKLHESTQSHNSPKVVKTDITHQQAREENMALLSLKMNENQNRYQNPVVLLEDFESSLFEWIDDTNRVIKELRKLAKDLNEHFHKINIAKVSGSGGIFAGSILMAVGLVLIPFSFGASLGLSIAGGALVAAGSATRLGSTVADKVLSGDKQKATDALLENHALSTQVVKDKCIDIGSTLQNLGKIEECFPEWVEFWAKVVGLSTKRNDRKWSSVTNKMEAEFDSSAATLRVRLNAYGEHRVGLHTGSILVPLRIYTILDVSLDIYRKTPHRVSAIISSLSDILEKQCPTVKDSSEMIKKIKCRL